MDKEYIIKHNLMEAHKQFMRLSEGPLYQEQLKEAGEDENQDGMPQDGQGMNPEQQPMDPDQQMPQGDNMPPQGMDGQQPMDQGGPIGPEAPMPGGDMGGDMPMGPDAPMPDGELEAGEDEEVLDVDDLTKAQEELNKKQNSLGHDLGELDDRIISLLTAVEKIQGSLDKNNSDIENLKAELEKRVPTQTEKLNMQSLKMYPYNVSPNDFWNKKELEGGYQAEGDDEHKEEHKITNADVNDYNEGEIEKSFDGDDDELHQTMRDIFKGF